MRETLPTRRLANTTTFEHEGLKYILTFSCFPNGEVAEVFLNTEMKSGSLADISVQDGAVLLSLALQHGCPVSVLREAVKRDPQGKAQGPLGQAIDVVCGELNVRQFPYAQE